MKKLHNILIIGGSAGSLQVLLLLLKSLAVNLHIPVIVVLHRQRNVVSEMHKILGSVMNGVVVEPDDKETIEPGKIYLAPQNYHLLMEDDGTISLDYSEVIKYSRPSIDVTFESAAQVYGTGVVAILLSGANSDGASGMEAVIAQGGKAIVQDPSTAEYPAMPLAACKQNPKAIVLSPEAIVHYLETIVHA